MSGHILFPQAVFKNHLERARTQFFLLGSFQTLDFVGDFLKASFLIMVSRISFLIETIFSTPFPLLKFLSYSMLARSSFSLATQNAGKTAQYTSERILGASASDLCVHSLTSQDLGDFTPWKGNFSWGKNSIRVKLDTPERETVRDAKIDSRKEGTSGKPQLTGRISA